MTNPNELNQYDISSGNNTTVWVDTAPWLNFKELQEDINTDTVIIGGGMAGLTTAYLLATAGHDITLIEDGMLGSGESGRTTAHLTCALDDRYYFLENTFGLEGSKMAADSHTAAVDLIESIINRENILCDFKRIDGYLFTDPSDKSEHLDKKLKATQNAGIETEMSAMTPGLKKGTEIRSIRFPRQGQFHVLKYIKGLTDAIVSHGGKIFTGTRASRVDKNGVLANGFYVTANNVVVATNSPINDLLVMHTKQNAYRSYVVGCKIPKGSLPYHLWWDTGNQDSQWVAKPYHYVRLQSLDSENDLLIVGGEDHKTGQEDEEDITQNQRYANLVEWAHEHFPHVGEIAYKWSGQVLEPIDGLGYMGKNPGDDNIYIITGHSGNGMTNTTIGAMIVSDGILGKRNKWSELYDPSRITFKTADDYIKETGNMAAQFIDWIKPGDIKSKDDLLRGEGGILTSGLKKLAVYRDDDGIVHSFSAVCPHLGCIVHWNKDEKTFDCPCHGSRFGSDGCVVNGPANTDLSEVKE